MSRIKKRGLDYFPMNTDFMHDRLVRRIMKREGDGAFAILLGALSCIYADEGYYVCADELFYEDLSACLYEKTADDVKRILALAVEYGIFSAQLFEQYAILTSAEIQRQYLFSTKRRKSSAIDPSTAWWTTRKPKKRCHNRKETPKNPVRKLFRNLRRMP